MDDSKPKPPDRRAAVLCSHVADDHLPILRAQRDPPLMDEDSGWQFLCGPQNHEDFDEPTVWGVFEVLALDPSVASLIDMPPGTITTRKDQVSAWEMG